MAFEIDFSAESERDFALIFDHLFESYLSFGESVEEALNHGTQRVLGIRKAADRLSLFPIRGTLRDDVLPASDISPLTAPSTGSTSMRRRRRSKSSRSFSAVKIMSAICSFVCSAAMCSAA